MNRVILTGRIANDLELKTSNAGKSFMSFGLAVNAGRERTHFFDVVCFGKTAELLNQYRGKGSKILVEGYLSTRAWTDKQGNKRKSVEVIANNTEFLDSRKEQTGSDGFGNSNSGFGSNSSFIDVSADEDLPF
jgi:single-strand DNA-binding protein